MTVVLSKYQNQDDIVRQRIKDIQKDPSIGRSEKELDAYLKKLGVRVEQKIKP